MTNTHRKIKKALISVSDKRELESLVKKLKEFNVEIVSSGGTGQFIRQLGYDVVDIQNVTGNPEAFGGRMKTLSFQVSSALLFRRGHAEDEKQASELNIEPIDLVVCNLYPFSEVAKRGGEWDELIENIDIGGPTMIRAAAKNHNDVTVITDPDEYARLIEELDKHAGQTTLECRKDLALMAYRHTAAYDGMIAAELETRMGKEEKTISLDSSRSKLLRYGENPHQKGWVYANHRETGLASVVPLQGKELSYNNLLDADAAWRSCSDLNQLADKETPSAVTVIKHSNPCGASLASSQVEALELAWNGDPISAFGSIICFNQNVSGASASWLSDKFVEVVIAPGFDSEAKELFAKKKNLRLIKLDPHVGPHADVMIRSISGGWIVQEEDNGPDVEYQQMTTRQFNEDKLKLARFGTLAAKHLKSNAIALVAKKDNGVAIVGAGMGNPNRLISTQQAVEKARENGLKDLSETVLISDAFFPFRDNVDMASEHGIKHIVQPGGSMRDQDTIEACNEHGMAMVFTGRRHFRH